MGDRNGNGRPPLTPAPEPAPPASEPVTLSASYRLCRWVHAHYGRSFYLATTLLPAWKRRHVHALYALTRYADEIVDDPASPLSPTARGERLGWLRQQLDAALAGEATAVPVLPAAAHTLRGFAIPLAEVELFFAAMRMDTERCRYRDYPQLLRYMDGSAAVIGTMLLPVLEPLPEDPGRPGSAAAAREAAQHLGYAFQLTNFLRDVAEDADRGRIYLPEEDLERFGVSPSQLRWGQPVTPGLRELLAFEAERAREHYRRAEAGIGLLAPSSGPCLRAAVTLYGGILTEIERAGYDVLTRRARVPRWRRGAAAVRFGAQAAGVAWRGEHR